LTSYANVRLSVGLCYVMETAYTSFFSLIQSHNISTKSNFAFERLVNQVTPVFVHLVESHKICAFAMCGGLYLHISSLHLYTLIWTISRAEN